MGRLFTPLQWILWCLTQILPFGMSMPNLPVNEFLCAWQIWVPPLRIASTSGSCLYSRSHFLQSDSLSVMISWYRSLKLFTRAAPALGFLWVHPTLCRDYSSQLLLPCPQPVSPSMTLQCNYWLKMSVLESVFLNICIKIFSKSLFPYNSSGYLTVLLII